MKKCKLFLITCLILVFTLFPTSFCYAGQMPQPGSHSNNQSKEVSIPDSVDVYVYLKITGDTSNYKMNGHYWYTVGKVTVSGLQDAAVRQNSNYITSGSEYDIVMKALSNIEKYSDNASIDLSKADFTSFGLKNEPSGADNYVNTGWTWHLDGTIDISDVPEEILPEEIEPETPPIVDQDDSKKESGSVTDPEKSEETVTTPTDTDSTDTTVTDPTDTTVTDPESKNDPDESAKELENSTRSDIEETVTTPTDFTPTDTDVTTPTDVTTDTDTDTDIPDQDSKKDDTSEPSVITPIIVVPSDNNEQISNLSGTDESEDVSPESTDSKNDIDQDVTDDNQDTPDVTIGNDKTPLSDLPTIKEDNDDNGSEGTIVIGSDKTPLSKLPDTVKQKTTQSDTNEVPKTGDEQNILFYLLLSLISLVGLTRVVKHE